MKKFLIFLLFIIVSMLSACDSNQTIEKGNVSSTDLQSVSIENIKIRDSIKDVDLTKYAISNSFEEKPNNYNFEKLRLITDDNGFIVKITGNILGYVTVGDVSTNDGISYSINGSTLFYTIYEIMGVLGNNYHEYWYDKGQHLKAYTYTDKENEISLTFVCDDNSKNFVWIILSE